MARRMWLPQGAAPLLALLAACSVHVPEAPPDPPRPAAGEPVPIEDLIREDLGDPLSPPPSEEVEAELLELPWILDSETAGRVEFWLGYWGGGRGTEAFARALSRMGAYQGLVDREIEARGLPPVLRYLPIVESAYSPVAVSRVGATGLWQFTGPTARHMGLAVTPLVDERRDPVRSTQAALDYIVDLYDRFGSWYLTLAAYNGGPNRLGRVIESHGGVEMDGDSLFLAIRPRLPRETRDFVPKLLAASRIARFPARYGIDSVAPLDPFEVDEVVVPDATSLDILARAADVPEKTIESLNPHLVRGFTPAGRETMVRVPAGRGELFRERYAEIPPSERITVMEHVVARGETFSHIAARYGVSVAELQAANPSIRPRRMQVGRTVIVPRGPGGGAAPARAAAADGGSDTDPVRHRVRPGETLSEIARRYGVSVESLRSWNGLTGDRIRAGATLEVRPGRVVVYRVQPGDTLSGIARSHGMGTLELARANGLDPRDVIRPGDRLRIPSPGR